MATTVDRLAQGRLELEDALEARDEARRRFERSIGTSTEMSAYEHLRRATRRVAVAGRELEDGEAAEGEFLHA